MTPPLKRARIPSATATESHDCIHAHNIAVKGFLDELDTIESTKPTDSMPVLLSAASLLVEVKSSQRKIFQMLDAALRNRDIKREELERKNLLLENLVYERNHLKAQLDVCKEFPTPHLERMSRDELCDNDAVESAERIMNRFLCGSTQNSIQDPKNHKTIMTKLHKELNSRGLLQRDLEKAQSTLLKRKLVADKEEAFMRDLPKKLEMIEKSSVPLQEFFQSSASDHALRLIGSDRKKRLQLAQSLPGPLYALFVQLQALLDCHSQENESVTLQTVSKDGKGKNADEAPFEAQVVQLGFLVPDIHAKDPFSGKKKRVTVEFAFLQEFSLVTARAFGGGDKINSKLLLTNIFPGDSGVWNGQLDDSTRLSGKPYHWCNFLAGLVFPSPMSGNTVHLSTKAVVRAIEKRVRANATLTQLLLSFERKKVLVPPSFTETLKISDCGAKLTGWTVVDGGVTGEEESATYAATIKDGNRMLTARVLINWCHYPVIRPVWSLCEGQEAWAIKHGSVSKLHGDENPLYVNSLGQIESRINEETDDLDLSCSEWVLSFQVIKLLRLWSQCETGGHRQEGDLGGSSRSMKGRDRVSII
jgi:hypothetical protein